MIIPHQSRRLGVRGCGTQRFSPQVQSYSTVSTHSSTSLVVKEQQPASGRTLPAFFSKNGRDSLPSVIYVFIRCDGLPAPRASTVLRRERASSACPKRSYYTGG